MTGMALDFKKHFVQYEALIQMVDAIFEKVKNEYPKRSSAGKNAVTAAMPCLT